MTQEDKDKDLLLKYLCMALPYKLKVETPYNCATLIGIINRKGFKKDIEYIDVLTDKQTYPIRYIKPFLRPMSSMTEEEIIEFNNIPSTKNYQIVKGDLSWDVANYKQIGWLLEHYFDFMGLIPKDLAIEVTENNNPYKE